MGSAPGLGKRFRSGHFRGGGNAEGFKFGPVMGQYVAERALGEGDADFAKGFAIPEHDFETPPTPAAQPTIAAKPTDCMPRPTPRPTMGMGSGQGEP